MDIKYNFIGNLIRAGGDAKTVKGHAACLNKTKTTTQTWRETDVT